MVGSVHFLGDDGAVDDPRYDVWETLGDADELWRRYFEWLAEVARSGLFDILAHPDLVKIWGDARPAPERDPRHYYEPVVEAVAEAGIAVEVSTAGLRKPVGEIYPVARRSPRCASRPAPRSRSPPTPTPPTRSASATTARWSSWPAWGWSGSASSRAGERRLEPLGRAAAVEPEGG